jgi:hypothetical protein
MEAPVLVTIKNSDGGVGSFTYPPMSGGNSSRYAGSTPFSHT